MEFHAALEDMDFTDAFAGSGDYATHQANLSLADQTADELISLSGTLSDMKGEEPPAYVKTFISAQLESIHLRTGLTIKKDSLESFQEGDTASLESVVWDTIKSIYRWIVTKLTEFGQWLKGVWDHVSAYIKNVFSRGERADKQRDIAVPALPTAPIKVKTESGEEKELTYQEAVTKQLSSKKLRGKMAKLVYMQATPAYLPPDVSLKRCANNLMGVGKAAADTAKDLFTEASKGFPTLLARVGSSEDMSYIREEFRAYFKEFVTSKFPAEVVSISPFGDVLENSGEGYPKYVLIRPDTEAGLTVSDSVVEQFAANLSNKKVSKETYKACASSMKNMDRNCQRFLETVDHIRLKVQAGAKMGKAEGREAVLKAMAMKELSTVMMALSEIIVQGSAKYITSYGAYIDLYLATCPKVDA